MHGDKEVGLVAIGNIGTRVQGDKDIGLSRIDDFHVRAVALYQPAEAQGNVQVDGFLFGQPAYSPSVMASMTRVDDQRKLFRLGLRHGARNLSGSQHNRGCQEQKNC